MEAAVEKVVEKVVAVVEVAAGIYFELMRIIVMGHLIYQIVHIKLTVMRFFFFNLLKIIRISTKIITFLNNTFTFSDGKGGNGNGDDSDDKKKRKIGKKSQKFRL